MNDIQLKHYNTLYQQHINALHRQGKAASTIDVYSRAVRRITEFFDRCPDTLTIDNLKTYFTSLVHSHSWSTVKVDRNGLQFFYKHVLNRKWHWVDIVKPPQKKILPDILTQSEIEYIINSTRELRYQTFILTAYSMGLRLGETLELKIGDIDAQRMKVHVRLGKGQKDRFVTLPNITLVALRYFWKTHRNPHFIFPRGRAPAEQKIADQTMDRSGLQKSFKVIIKSCNIHKNITPHSLRHCYGAHLTQSNVHLRAIQTEMGHACPKTTALYTQLTDEVHQNSQEIINALMDKLDIKLDGEV
jgi:site-specific recombinase XerD